MIERPVPAVAAVVAREGEILLVKRGVEPSKGKWSIPGGRVEWGETLVEAVKREVREETGLEVEVDGVAGVFDLIAEDAPAEIEPHPSGIAWHYVIIDYFAHPVGGALSPGDDASEARWVSLGELDRYELTPHLRERLEEMGIL